MLLFEWPHQCYIITYIHQFPKQLLFYICSNESLQDMQCMLLTDTNSLLMGGHQPLLMELDLETQQQKRQVEVAEPGCAIFRYSSQFVCAGDTSGKVQYYMAGCVTDNLRCS